MRFNTNINDYVRVRLTPIGIRELQRRRAELNQEIMERGGTGFGEYQPKVDAAGYTRFQFHTLMHTFGHMMDVGTENPFDTDIVFERGEALFRTFYKADPNIPAMAHLDGKAFEIIGEEFFSNPLTGVPKPHYKIRFPDGEELTVPYELISST